MSLARLWPLAFALAACTEAPRPAPTSNVRYYQVDLQGQSQRCAVPTDVALNAATPAEARMEVLNDGGWCGITVAQPGPKPYDAGLVSSRPAHGRVRVQTVGDKTRVDYIPDPGFSGTDAFAVRLLPNNATLRVAVAVTPGASPVVPAAAAPAAAPAQTPARPVTRTPPRPARP